VKNLERDLAAVAGAVSTKWSNGPIELKDVSNQSTQDAEAADVRRSGDRTASRSNAAFTGCTNG
jgi:hypothetical protein